MGFNSNQKAVSYSTDVQATIPPVGMSCQASVTIAHSSQKDGTDDYFSPPAVCIASSSTRKASQEG